MTKSYTKIRKKFGNKVIFKNSEETFGDLLTGVFTFKYNTLHLIKPVDNFNGRSFELLPYKQDVVCSNQSTPTTPEHHFTLCFSVLSYRANFQFFTAFTTILYVFIRDLTRSYATPFGKNSEKKPLHFTMLRAL